MMGLYRIYIDEVGNHDLSHTDDPNHRFLSLTGVILESKYTYQVLIPEMDAIKRKYFQTDPDVPVIFHRSDMINHRPPFSCLNDLTIEQQFNRDILDALAGWNYLVITVAIDKKEHLNKYAVWHYHPYHYCLSVLLERFVLFLYYKNNLGDVMVETRGGKEDEKLKSSFTRLYEQGTDHIASDLWQRTLTSRELKVKPKTANIAGLQLADLIAHPSRREILIEHQMVIDQRNIFGDQISAILRQSKYYRSGNGQIEGYGKKLLP
ncbi:DUF3800 domain-containing protein [Longilinea arvoryzae]|nr:DUF3800 domain-containing protein [Longilinea arvoryzae]